MKPEVDKRRPGRPAGRARPHKVFSYLSDGEFRLLERLEAQLRRSRADVVREAVLALARAEGVGPDEGA